MITNSKIHIYIDPSFHSRCNAIKTESLQQAAVAWTGAPCLLTFEQRLKTVILLLQSLGTFTHFRISAYFLNELYSYIAIIKL